jgi:hypothetical protein
MPVSIGLLGIVVVSFALLVYLNINSSIIIFLLGRQNSKLVFWICDNRGLACRNN